MEKMRGMALISIGFFTLVAGCLGQQEDLGEIGGIVGESPDEPSADAGTHLRNYSGRGRGNMSDAPGRPDNLSPGNYSEGMRRNGSGMQRGMPAEASGACEGKSEGDECEFSIDDRIISGRCASIDSVLVCRPEFQQRLNRGERI